MCKSGLKNVAETKSLHQQKMISKSKYLFRKNCLRMRHENQLEPYFKECKLMMPHLLQIMCIKNLAATYSTSSYSKKSFIALVPGRHDAEVLK